jgi:hypothetical protein
LNLEDICSLPNKEMPNSPTQFVLAIVFPGTATSDIVSAAVRHHVHIVDKETFDAKKDYAAESRKYTPYINGSRIMLLFIFPDGNSVLADSDKNLQSAVGRIREMSN